MCLFLALLAPLEGPKQRKYWSDEMIKVLLDTCIEEMKTTGRKSTSLHKQSWVRLGRIHTSAGSLKSKPLPYFDLCEIVFQSIYANGDGQWTNTGQEFGAFAYVSVTSAFGPSTSWASTSGASVYGAPIIRERVRVLNMDDDPLVDVAIDDDDDDDGNSRAHKIHDEVRPKKKSKDLSYPVFLAAFNIFGQSRQIREAWMILSSEPDVLKGKAKRKRNNVSAMSGHQFTLELLQGNDRQRIELLRMSHDSFIRLCTHFRGAVGALDGTLIYACVPKNKQHLYGGRGKGGCYQNVLAICDFNMMFTFLVAGWEGVAYDSRILSEGIRNLNAPFPLPPLDKYYLYDVTYAHTRGFMEPYRNVRYWLGDFWRRRALNSKEKFNHSHAKLRNVIERVYGVLKARFLILNKMAPFPLTTQRNIMIACFALHNFIRKEGLDDELFSTYDQSNVQFENENLLVEDDGGIEEDQVVQPQGNASDRQYMTNLRDQIAQQLMQSG
ncbi:putative nuclease HARBI1 [Tanacetum coccineum]